MNVYIGNLTTALNRFEPAERPFAAGGVNLSAWNSEIVSTRELWGRDIVFASGYQNSSQALSLRLVELRFLAAASMVIFFDTSLTLEYYHDKDYSLDDRGTGGSGYGFYGFTTRLAYEF